MHDGAAGVAGQWGRLARPVSLVHGVADALLEVGVVAVAVAAVQD